MLDFCIVICRVLPHTVLVCTRLPRDLSCVSLNADRLQKRISNYPMFLITPLYPTIYFQNHRSVEVALWVRNHLYSYIAKHPINLAGEDLQAKAGEWPVSRKAATLTHQLLKSIAFQVLHQLSRVSWMTGRDASDLVTLTVLGPLLCCFEAAHLAANPQGLRSLSTGGKIERSAIGVLRDVASSWKHWLCAMNTKSEDVSLQADCLHSSAIDPGVLKIVTRLAWENVPNAIICVGASRS